MPRATTRTARRRHLPEQPRDEAAADQQGEAHQQRQFDDGPAQRLGDSRRPGLLGAEEDGEEHEHQDGEEVLDHQPADGDVAGRGVQLVVVGEHPQQHHGAGDGDGQAEDQPRRPAPAQLQDDEAAEQGGHQALANGAGDRDPPHLEQLLEVELEADAEHQEDDSDLGELIRQLPVGDEAGGVGADGEAGQQVADDGREPKAVGHVAQNQGGRKAAGQGQDQFEAVHLSHASPPAPRPVFPLSPRNQIGEVITKAMAIG
jgi:hypothetical protein